MINWIEEVGYVEGKRISLSIGEEKDQAGYYATGFIPVKYGQTVRIKGIDVTDNNMITITSFDADKNPIFSSSERCGTTLYHAFVEKGTDEGNGVYAAVVNTVMYTCFTSDVAYIRISSTLITDESIVTVDQEIVDITPETPETPTDINILTSGKYTIDFNKRWSSSSNSLVDCNGMICITIPISDILDKTIRIKGFTPGLAANGKTAIWYLYKDATKTGACRSDPDDEVVWNCVGLSQDVNGVYSVTVNNESFANLSNSNILYANLAISTSAAIGESDLANKIITIDNPIPEDEGNVITYTNQIPISINADGTLFVGADGQKGYDTGNRISLSGGGLSAQEGTEYTGFIPATKDSILRIKNIAYDGDTTRGVVAYNANFEKTPTGSPGINIQALFGTYGYDDGNGVRRSGRLGGLANFNDDANIRYIRLCSTDINENSILTVDEAIV